MTRKLLVGDKVRFYRWQDGSEPFVTGIGIVEKIDLTKIPPITLDNKEELFFNETCILE